MVKRYSDSIVTNTTAVSENLTNLMEDIRAEHLLKTAAYYIDAIDSSSSGQTIDNLGTAKDLLPTTVGSSTSADSNDPVYLSHTGTNYVYTPGVTNNNLSVPDAAALDITGDIDLRWYGALDDWTPSSAQALISKRTSSNHSYELYVDTNGTLAFTWSTDGTTGIFKNSTSATGVADGSAKWVRVILDVDNGSTQNEVKFYTSDNGTSWTQLGTTVTTAGVTSIFSGTAEVCIGARSTTSANEIMAGKHYRAQIFNGIDGTKVLDVDTSVINNGSATSFTAVTGQTVTINRSTSGRKTVAVTQPTWLFGTDDFMEVNNRYMDSGTYLYLPGVTSNNATAPDSAALDITGDIDLRAKVALDDWTPTASSFAISKNQSGQTAYYLNVLTTGALRLMISLNGTTETLASSTVVTGFTDGATKWIRATRVAATGNVKFFTSDDGTTWTQLGVDVSTATGNIAATTAILEIGTTGNGGNAGFRGKVFRAQVFNGIDGTVAFDANFETGITSLNQASFTESSSNAATVTINRNGSAYRSAGITTAGYLYPGATNTFSASATDFLNFGASDSFTIIAVTRDFGEEFTLKVYIAKKVEESGPASPGYLLWRYAFNTYAQISDSSVYPGNFFRGIDRSKLSTATFIRNVSADTTSLQLNTATSTSITDTTTSTLSNVLNFRIGVLSSGYGYGDFEIYAAAVFRRALTSAEISLISGYFQRRDT